MATNASTTLLIGGEQSVHRLGFGAMRLGLGRLGGRPRDPETGIAVLRRAIELGVDHIDTADFYEFGGVSSNELIRKALHPYPAELVIATKVGPLRDENTGLPAFEAGPGQLRGLVQDNLRRLGLDRLDLVYLRVGGMSTPAGDSLGERFAALAALREEGLIRHLGISNVTTAQLDEARAIAPVAAVQNHFHVHHRDDTELLARCEQLGIAYVPFFPLGGGNSPLDQTRLAAVAKRHDATAAQVALAWLLAASPVMVLIPGTGSPQHLEENMAAPDVRLTDEDLAELSLTQ